MERNPYVRRIGLIALALIGVGIAIGLLADRQAGMWIYGAGLAVGLLTLALKAITWQIARREHENQS